MDEPARRRLGLEVEFRQAALQQYPCAFAASGGRDVALERDQSAVGVLADRVELDGAFERGEAASPDRPRS